MSYDDMADWQRQWLEAQQLQLKAYEQWFGASHQLVEAQRKSIEAAENAFKMQWRWLTFWGL
jgi:hypothetical protein